MILLLLCFAWAFTCASLPLSIAGSNLGWGLVVLALLVRHFTGRRVPWSLHRGAIETPLFAYLMAAALSCAFGTSPSYSFTFLIKDAHKVWIYLVYSVGLAALIEEDPDHAWTVPGALALGLAVSATVGLWQTFSSAGPLWTRARAFMHPVTFGEQMALGALGAFCFAEFSPRPGKVRAPALALFALCSIALFFSQTRGAILALAAGFFTIAWFSKHDPRIRAAVAGVVSLIGVFASDLLPTGRSLIESLARQPAAANPQLARWTLWKVSWRMFLDHPLFGVGINNYREQFVRYFSGTIDGETAFGTAHNLYLHQTAERGLVGAAALAWLLIALWRRSAERAIGKPSPASYWALGATAAFLAMNCTEVALQVEQLWMLFFVIWIFAEQQPHRA